MRHNDDRPEKRLSGMGIGLSILCIVIVYAGVLLGIKLIGDRMEAQKPPETVGSLEGRFKNDDVELIARNRAWKYRGRTLTNILFIGVDWAKMEHQKDSVRYGGQADYLMLMSLDRKNKTIHLVQIDRDTMTPIRIYGPFGDYAGTSTEQICLSYAYGYSPEECGRNCAWAVGKLLGGIPIDAYVTMDTEGISILNDALGGVTVTLEDDFSFLDPTMTAGSTITLQGKQAEFFVRRRMDVGEGTNVARMKRQSMFVEEAYRMLIEGMKEDMSYIGTLYDTLSGHLFSSQERGWLINRAYESKEYERMDITNIAGYHLVGEDGFMEFEADQDALTDMLTEVFFE